MDKFDEQATNLLIDLGVQVAGKTKELEALRDRIGQFGRDADRKAREECAAEGRLWATKREFCKVCGDELTEDGYCNCAETARELDAHSLHWRRESGIAGSGHECTVRNALWDLLNDCVSNLDTGEHFGEVTKAPSISVVTAARAALAQPCPAPLLEGKK